MSQSYHEQFRDNQRNKNQNDLYSNSKATAGSKLPPQRPTAVVKQPLRSDTFTLPTKRDQTNVKVPKLNQAQNGSRRHTSKEPAVINSLATPPAEETMRRNGGTRPTLKSLNSPMDRQNLRRNPVRFANDHDNTYHPSSHASPPVYYQKHAPLADPLPQNALDKSRRMRIVNDDYVVHRRRDSPSYAYTDYQTVSNKTPNPYGNSFPPISQSTNQTVPTVIIRPRETVQPEPPPPPPPPIFILPPPATPTSNMMYQNSTFPSYSQNPTMIFPTVEASAQPPVQTFFLQPPPNPTFFSQPFLCPMPFSNPNPPMPAPPPPPPNIINQSSSSSASASAAVGRTETRTADNNTTIIVRPHTTSQNNKNVTIRLQESPPEIRRSQRVVRVVRDPPYHDEDDVYYVESEPNRVIYEQPTRRTRVVRRPPATEYVYVDEPPPPIVRRRPHRPEVVYVDNDRPLEYEEEIVYVDDNGNDIEYIYDNEPSYHRRNHRHSRHPSSSTNIVYK